MFWGEMHKKRGEMQRKCAITPKNLHRKSVEDAEAVVSFG